MENPVKLAIVQHNLQTMCLITFLQCFVVEHVVLENILKRYNLRYQFSCNKFEGTKEVIRSHKSNLSVYYTQTYKGVHMFLRMTIISYFVQLPFDS
jgi:hypothetical protein